eukprot:TRINITY_DN1445_c0_g1_i1.p1 TRINITY_DN1445_c0_g1~~TRINITY_DN1445_c0_g1_i1.p1  ORF type:complete len:727 (+),score=136.48 TRINITY_DN1445_c0_g1_i1:310-2490(+)
MKDMDRLIPRRAPSAIALRSAPNKLHQAVAAKDLTAVRARLAQTKKAKTEICEYDNMEQTPLQVALRNGSVEIVRELLTFFRESKCDINMKDKNGYTALHVAASFCDDQLLNMLLSYEGTDVNIVNDDLNTPLHYFCQKFKSPNCQESFQLFIRKGVHVNAQNKNGETPLHKSIFNNTVRLLMVNLLLEAGADVNILNSRGESPLHFAVRLGREDLVSVLIRAGADITVRGSEKKSCYELAVESKNQKVIAVLKNVQDIYDWLLGLALEQYWKLFVKEEIFKDVLADVDEKTLDSMGITSTGHRLKILKACRSISNPFPSFTSVSSITSTPTASPSPSSSSPLSIGFNSNSHNHNSPSLQNPLYKHDKHRPSQSNSEETSPIHSGESSNSGMMSGVSSSSFSSDDIKETLAYLSVNGGGVGMTEWVIDHSKLEYTLKLGAGSSGKVYKGLYKGQEVAVKVLKAITTQEQLEEFKKEFQIMCAIRSPNIVTFFGACLEPKLCMVMEYCARDSLYHVMNNKRYDLGWDKFFKFSKEMTAGMLALHGWSPQIVHRDFKSLNLLVNEQWDCKLADFGLSRFNTADNLETLSKIRGTFAYCAPEVATGVGTPYSTKSDVYSIGIVLWELVTRIITGEYARPFSEYNHIKVDFQIMLNSKEGLRPTLPANTPEVLVTLYKKCVAQEPEERPDCTDIMEALRAAEEMYTGDKQGYDLLRKNAVPAASAPVTPS